MRKTGIIPDRIDRKLRQFSESITNSKPGSIFSNARKGNIILARKIYFHVMYEVFDIDEYKLSDISGLDRSTILVHLKNTEEQIPFNPSFAANIRKAIEFAEELLPEVYVYRDHVAGREGTYRNEYIEVNIDDLVRAVNNSISRSRRGIRVCKTNVTY